MKRVVAARNDSIPRTATGMRPMLRVRGNGDSEPVEGWLIVTAMLAKLFRVDDSVKDFEVLV
jgi:hypothetical protein